ncbi:alpha/beta hydrolase family protein [Spongiivirga citrea]|uniref:Alpha/beta hydrolase n=1 Tax=Spongiivirga citrea TaxID=1481457 RepID=A0A6M0CI68_9FLAO|nr:alpha/beta hydrolase [Spongiivirga citrea]NER17222.1 alpha/beta hydrolase [Spongiivirga citrea]
MIIKKNIVIERADEKPMLADFFYQENSQPKPIVIFCHGYKGFKDWGCWDLVAKAFAENGFFFLKFNFSHNGGTIEQPIDFPDLEAFANNNYSQELKDLGDVIDLIVDYTEIQNEIDTNAISLIGHSRGGGIVTLKAAQDRRVTKVITWAGVSDYKKRFPQGEAFEKWEKDGVYYVLNGRTKQEMPHYFQYFEDFIENEEKLTIKTASQQLKIPQLIIHGTADESVSTNDAADLHWWYPLSQIKWIEGANHVFGGKHPWESDELPEHLQEVISESVRFLG